MISNPEERGWIRALTESHILFDETLSGGLARIDLGKYKTIILPEKPRLAPPALERLMIWVQQGGTLLYAINTGDATWKEQVRKHLEYWNNTSDLLPGGAVYVQNWGNAQNFPNRAIM